MGLIKDKIALSKQTRETHANDGLALAASHFMQFEKFHTANTRGHHWSGQIEVTDAPFRVIARPNIYRRQLHFEKPDSQKPNLNQYRKRKGGTVTPFGLRSGDLVEPIKQERFLLAGLVVTQIQKNNKRYRSMTLIGSESDNSLYPKSSYFNVLQEFSLVPVNSVRHSSPFNPTGVKGDSCRLMLKQIKISWLICALCVIN